MILLRNVGYRSCVPWLKELKANISTTRKAKLPRYVRCLCPTVPSVSRAALALHPRRRLIHFCANVDHQKCRQRADHEHSAPAHEAERRSVDQSRHQIAHRIAFLQQPGKKSAPFRGQRFERQRRAHAPFAAHRNSEQRPRDQRKLSRKERTPTPAQTPNTR